MKIPNWLKVIYWMILTSTISYFFVYEKYDLIEKGNHFYLFVFIIWVVLLLLPLFSEIKFFGMTFKKEIESVKKEIEFLRLSINNTNNQSTNINIDRERIYTEKELPEALNKIEIKDSATHKIEIPIVAEKLFKTRYSIEKEIRRIDKLYPAQDHKFYNEDLKARNLSFHKIITELKGIKVIDDNLYNLILAVYRYTAPAVHGEEQLLKEKEIEFVEKAAPKLIEKLKEIK